MVSLNIKFEKMTREANQILVNITNLEHKILQWYTDGLNNKSSSAVHLIHSTANFPLTLTFENLTARKRVNIMLVIKKTKVHNNFYCFNYYFKKIYNFSVNWWIRFSNFVVILITGHPAIICSAYNFNIEMQIFKYILGLNILH